MLDRYGSPEMRAIWTDQAYIDRMVQIELEVLRRMHPEANSDTRPDPAPGYTKEDLPERIPSAEAIRDREKSTGHEITALLSIMDEYLGHSLVHAGLTSSDVTDTARAMQMQDAHGLLMAALEKLVSFINGEAHHHATTPIIARTHGQYAVPSTLGHRMNVWAYQLRTAGHTLHNSMTDIRGKLSGAVGTHVFVDKREVEVGTCAKLGVPAAIHSNQIVPRALWLQAWNAILTTITVCEKIANDLRVLNADGIEEFNPPAPRHSSSTMVHKQNPASLERVIGLSRLTRHLHHALAECVGDNWLERDLTNTSVERITIPQLYTYAECIITTLHTMLERGTWDSPQMHHNLTTAIERGALNEYGYVNSLNIGIPREQARKNATPPNDEGKVVLRYLEAARDDVVRGPKL